MGVIRDEKGRLARLQGRLRDPILTALTILLAFLVFVVAPLRGAGIIEAPVFEFGLVTMIIGALLVVSASPTAIIALLPGFGLAVAAAVLRLLEHSILNHYFEAGAFMLLALALIWVVAGAVFAPGRVTYHRIMGAILLYLTVGLMFVALYTWIALLDPKAFAGVTLDNPPALIGALISVSFGTLTTIGPGSFVPLHPMAQSLCNLEAMIGQLYPATLLARFVTLEIEDRRR